MLVCETGGATPQDIEDLAVFVSQLREAGVLARIDIGAIAEADLPRNARFDVAPCLFEGPPDPEARVVVTAAQALTEDRLIRLRRLAGDAPRACTAIGAFASPQAVIGLRAKLSYVFGVDPDVIELDATPSAVARCTSPVFGVARPAGRPGRPRLLLVAPYLAQPAEARALKALALSPAVTVAVLTDGETKHAWLEANGPGIPFYHFGEVLPAGLARRVDVCVLFAAMPTSYRVQCLVANLAVSAAALVDGSDRHEVATALDAVVPGPPDIASLGGFLTERILPNLDRIGAQARASQTVERLVAAPLLERLGATPPPERQGAALLSERLGAALLPERPSAAPLVERLASRRAGENGLPRPERTLRRADAPQPQRRVTFMPTNGIGLGHAQRCTQIAAALDADRTQAVFAAFPGCMRLVKGRGFDVVPLVGRSGLHALPYENDLPNYLRLRAIARDAAALVFDGGYVFDSVYRTVVETGVAGIWIRRGLWQATQDNSVALDREKAFVRVLVPGEAFEELNAGYSRGEHLRPVGPIVTPVHLAPAERAALRARLAERFARPFERLVVTMLGAGVAADRSAQIQALSAMLERRPDVLHLVVVWPSSVLRPAWFGWRNTRIVRTHRANALAAAADFWVTAAGYNSFLEAMYGAVPSIFVPQMGPFMDDQRTRAAAAVERGLAAMVEPTDLLALDRLVDRFLDGGEAEALRTRLADIDLPAPGTAEAARVIEEVAHGL
jgi:hypothetical protein